MRFYFIVLVSSLKVGKRFTGNRRVSIWCNRHQFKQTLKYSLQLRRDKPEVNAWGETHLYIGHCEVFYASGLAQPRIPVRLCRGVSSEKILLKRHVNRHRLKRESKPQ